MGGWHGLGPGVGCYIPGVRGRHCFFFFFLSLCVFFDFLGMHRAGGTRRGEEGRARMRTRRYKENHQVDSVFYLMLSPSLSSLLMYYIYN